MQACLLRVPCIVSDINGCNEIIQDGTTGLIVPPKNSTALVTAMEVLMQDGEKRNTFAIRARDYVATHFDRVQVWTAIQREYERLMAEAASRA